MILITEHVTFNDQIVSIDNKFYYMPASLLADNLCKQFVPTDQTMKYQLLIKTKMLKKKGFPCFQILKWCIKHANKC